MVKKGEILEKFSKLKFIKASTNKQEIIQLNIYISENEIEKEYLEEKDYFGRLLLHIKSGYNGIIQLKINYDTVLSFSAIEYNNQKEIKTEFEFFK